MTKSNNTQNTPVEIMPAANGFIVTTGHRHRETSTESQHVFQTFEELNDFLSGHFTHREDKVLLDKPQE